MQDDVSFASGDLQGACRLAVEGVVAVTDIVESMHRNISGLAPLVGPSRQGGTRGITGLVYRSVRGVSRGVGFGLDLALERLGTRLGRRDSSPRREALLAALNGVLGDHLAASDNPLAISMSLRREGRSHTLERRALAKEVSDPKSKLLVLIHGLCMNELQWRQQEQNQSASLARDLGYTPLYLHYNSGLAIAENGRRFSSLLEQLVQKWPVPVHELVVLGHSMGGLVARSACHHATLAEHAWRRRLEKLVFLGTPHAGAPLERAGHWVDVLGGISPYVAPIARICKLRSAGVTDLRYGMAVDTVPLPAGVQCFAIAATRQRQRGREGARLRGDGLVPVRSALGQHEDPALSLPIPTSRRCIVYGLSHQDLLSSHEAWARVGLWLAEG